MSKVIHTNQGQFEQQVKQSDLPVLVDFYATWCPPCKMLSPILDSFAVDFAGRLKIVKINSDEEPALASEYNISSLPTLLLFNGGEVVGRIEGLPQERALREGLDKWLNDQRIQSR